MMFALKIVSGLIHIYWDAIQEHYIWVHLKEFPAFTHASISLLSITRVCQNTYQKGNCWDLENVIARKTANHKFITSEFGTVAYKNIIPERFLGKRIGPLRPTCHTFGNRMFTEIGQCNRKAWKRRATETLCTSQTS